MRRKMSLRFNKKSLRLCMITTILLLLYLSFVPCESRGELEPFDIWANFSSSGWMGDGEAGSQYIEFLDGWKGAPHSDPVCIKISYTPGPKGWAGIYWLNEPDNWGDEPGTDLSGYKKITFWAKGEKGGEIVEFIAGGIKGKTYEDSFKVKTGRVVLEKEWKQYTMSLKGQDLSSVIGGFCWVANDKSNPDGLTFYLDDIFYETD